MIVSLLTGKLDNRPDRVECSWEELVQTLSTHARRAGKEGPLFSPCEFDGRGKTKDCAVQVWFGVLDFDSVSLSDFQAALSRADALDAFAYSTHSHGPEQLKARLVVRWSRPVPAGEYRSAWLALAQAFPGADAQCKDANRFYYTPSCPPNGAPAFWRSSGGALWDPATLPAAEAPGAAPALDLLPPAALRRTLKKWARSPSAELRAVSGLLELGLDGKPMAAEGARDATLFRLACALAPEYPTTDPRALAAELSGSLSQWGAGDRPWGDLLAEKIARKQAEVLGARTAGADGLSSRQSENVQLSLGRAHPYTPEELAELSAAHPWPLRRRWLAAWGNSVYALVDGSYRGPWQGLSCGPALAQALAPATSAGVSVYGFDPKGEVKLRSPAELVEQFGVALDRVEADMTASRAYLAAPPGRVLVEAPCPLRDLEPVWDPEVAHWLALLCGDQPGREGSKQKALLDWLAVVTELSAPAPALYLWGTSGAGKNLLAYGLAKLWSSSPCPLSAAMSDFNDEILRCPLVFGDERIPDRNGVPRTEELRELVTQCEFTVNRKHAQRFVARGSVRVVLSANAPNLTSRNAELSADDVKALGDRLISVRCTPAARAFLESLSTETWARGGDRIAQHALWLREAARAGTRPVAPGTRLAVAADAAELVATIRVSSGVRWQVLYWVCSYLRAPEIHLRGCGGKPAIQVTGGVVSIAPSRLPECWGHYLGQERPPTVEKVLSAVRALTSGEGSFRRLEAATLASWADSAGEELPPLAAAEAAIIAAMN